MNPGKTDWQMADFCPFGLLDRVLGRAPVAGAVAAARGLDLAPVSLGGGHHD